MVSVSRYNHCIVTGEGLATGEIMSRYTVLYRNKQGSLGVVCHDTTIVS